MTQMLYIYYMTEYCRANMTKNVAQQMTKHLMYNMTMLKEILPNDKILDWSKLKQIADDILKSI